MRPVRASEIGTYLFCARAWWYQCQGLESQNQGELADGLMAHRQHGQRLLLADILRLLAWLLLLIALILLTTYCALEWV